jgi:hypothetical protein
VRALILAQGDGRRWQKPDGSYPLGVPKHFVEVDGVPLLVRLVGLLRDRGITDVVVVGPDDGRYRVRGADLVTVETPHPTGTSMDKMFATAPLWSPDGRTTILWGDCYYTDAAIDRIIACDEAEPHWYRRPGASKVTGHQWDESFALSFLPEHHERLLELAEAVNASVPPRKIHMFTLLAAWCGMKMPPDFAKVATLPNQSFIDDFTDDFDSWSEWCGWMGRYMAGKVDVAVCIPWFDTGCQYRRRALGWTANYWDELGFRVVYGDGESRSAARNDAVRKAGADVALIADADTVVPAHQVWAAAHLANISNRLVHAYVDHERIGRGATKRMCSTKGYKLPARSSRAIRGSSSGCIAVSRNLYQLVGGHDERFRAWGGEDRAFQYACDTLAGPGERITGLSYHLWHPPSEDAKADDPGHMACVELALRYKAAAGWEPKAGVLIRTPGVSADPVAMRSIMSEPGGPLEVSQ